MTVLCLHIDDTRSVASAIIDYRVALNNLAEFQPLDSNRNPNPIHLIPFLDILA